MTLMKVTEEDIEDSPLLNDDTMDLEETSCKGQKLMQQEAVQVDYPLAPFFLPSEEEEEEKDIRKSSVVVAKAEIFPPLDLEVKSRSTGLGGSLNRRFGHLNS